MNNKVALITGGARGIGFGAATKFAQNGYNLAIVGSSSHEKTEPAVMRLKEMGEGVVYIRADISCSVDRQRILDETLTAFGRVDVLVNNAGVIPKILSDVLLTTEESFDHVIGVNLKGTYFLTQIVAIHMISQLETVSGMRPKIVNVSSISATAASMNRGEYCVSKAGMSMITKLFATRLSPYGINVNEVRPGFILTDMTSAAAKERYDKVFSESDLVPLKRWGQSSDCGEAIYSLCTEAMSFVTGECLYVDGGLNIQRL